MIITSIGCPRTEPKCDDKRMNALIKDVVVQICELFELLPGFFMSVRMKQSN